MKRIKIIWTPGAVRDLEQIHLYIAGDAPRYADVVAARIVQAFDRVEEFPEIGRLVPKWGGRTCGS
ncbi:MAG: type II toxin-antitoxin system RelE/ParE family toxin [Gemmatimonadaceae bacterium]